MHANYKLIIRYIVPLTLRIDDFETDPTILAASQVYSPACLADTDSIVNCLTRFPELVIIISSLPGLSKRFSNIQFIFRGKSPLDTVHWTDTVSPAFAGSSPKENNAICGATMGKYLKYRYIINLF